MPTYMHGRRRAEDSQKIHKLKLLGKLWTVVIFKILVFLDTLILGVTRDPGKQIPKFGLIEEWQTKNGWRNFR